MASIRAPSSSTAPASVSLFLPVAAPALLYRSPRAGHDKSLPRAVAHPPPLIASDRQDGCGDHTGVCHPGCRPLARAAARRPRRGRGLPPPRRAAASLSLPPAPPPPPPLSTGSHGGAPHSLPVPRRRGGGGGARRPHRRPRLDGGGGNGRAGAGTDCRSFWRRRRRRRRGASHHDARAPDGVAVGGGRRGLRQGHGRDARTQPAGARARGGYALLVQVRSRSREVFFF